MAETVNLPRDSTLRELVAVQKASIIASGNAAAIDRLYGSLVRAAKSVEEVNTLFVDWWNICWKEGVTTRNELCGRWFGTVLDDNRVHGTKEPLFATSQSAIGEATDDSVGLVCTPSTEAAANRDDFAKLPQFWALEVAAEKNADGTHTIYAVEFIDSYDDVRRSKHLCWVLQKNPTRKNGMRAVIAISKCAATPAPGMKRGRRVRIKTALSTATLQTRSMLPDLTAMASSAAAVAVRPSTIPATATMWACGASAAHSMRAHPADCSNGSLP